MRGKVKIVNSVTVCTLYGHAMKICHTMHSTYYIKIEDNRGLWVTVAMKCRSANEKLERPPHLQMGQTTKYLILFI
jgi:hypothetical protein